MQSSKILLALDVGERRIGVARANTLADMASPLTTVLNDNNVKTTLTKLFETERANALVVGLPRGLDGQETAQTKYVQDFIAAFGDEIKIPVYWMDEAVTSVQAEELLKQSKGQYQKADIDALAACIILEDYLREHPEAK